ncbi:hypothetical protein BDW02DRAFT_605691 [Decorospora gaudefroyi]|uniref:Uncharacterized protein n=1 Tax=Decorospora gaudefroyi TaxID=184978 RepID=A0A6A5K413_9PLEO|nr:hypothetical protein BDW02DRAFT_605691 [Decorospora gaudefroyi]
MAEDFSKGQDDSELPPLDDSLVASAATRLDAAKIPHVLWGPYMLTIFGIPTIVSGIDFVVDDDSIEAAYTTLEGADSEKVRVTNLLPVPQQETRLPYAPTPSPHHRI